MKVYKRYFVSSVTLLVGSIFMYYVHKDSNENISNV